MNVRHRILLDYEQLHDGQTVAGQLCPACEGGESRERTFSVSRRDGKLFWNCHRATCDCRGSEASGSHSHGGTATQIPHSRGVVGRTILRQSSMVDEEVRAYLASRYCIEDRHISKYEIGWDNDTNRLCLPVKDVQGERLGCVLRALDSRKPKTLTHTEQGAISWHVNHTTPGVIIVEDQFSAIRASDYLTSVALLGTNLNDERVEEIKKANLGPVYLALDADAWQVAVRYAIKYRSTLKPQLLRLAKDIKDQTDEELTALFASIGK